MNRDGDVFAALDNRIASSHGVWKISGNGKKTERIAGSARGLMRTNHCGVRYGSITVWQR